MRARIGERRTGVCPHCGNEAPQKLVYRHECETLAYYLDDEPVKLERDHYVTVCETCGDLTLYGGWLGTYDDEDNRFVDAEVLWPEPPLDCRALPAAVAKRYTDAMSVRAKSPAAFSVLARKTLEALCTDKHIPKGKLGRRLKLLAERGVVPSTLAQMTHVLHVLGNIGAHEDRRCVNTESADITSELLQAVLSHVYVAPLRLEAALKHLGIGATARDSTDGKAGSVRRARLTRGRTGANGKNGS